MKNITLSAEEELIEKARAKARSRNSTLNAEFRLWLKRYSDEPQESERRVSEYRELMKKLAHVDTGGRRFTRDEMNER